MKAFALTQTGTIKLNLALLALKQKQEPALRHANGATGTVQDALQNVISEAHAASTIIARHAVLLARMEDVVPADTNGMKANVL